LNYIRALVNHNDRAADLTPRPDILAACF